MANEEIELEGIVQDTDLTRCWDDTGNGHTNCLYVLIQAEDGLLYNTILKNNNERLVSQLRHTIRQGDKIRVRVKKDAKETEDEGLPVYRVLSQYQVLSKEQPASAKPSQG